MGGNPIASERLEGWANTGNAMKEFVSSPV